MSIPARKTPQTVSRTEIYTKSAKNFTETIRFLFCTEKIILSYKLQGKLNKQKIQRKKKDLQLREKYLTVVKLKLKYLELRKEVVDGS